MESKIENNEMTEQDLMDAESEERKRKLATYEDLYDDNEDLETKKNSKEIENRKRD